MRAALLLLLLCACATTGPLPFLPDEALHDEVAGRLEAPAVVLHRSDRIELMAGQTGTSTDLERHVVTRVLTEQGFEAATVTLAQYRSAELVGFRARVVQPDGSAETFDRRDVRVDPGRTDDDITGYFFRFPSVRVGSVLEYSYRLHFKGLFYSQEAENLGQYPIRHYEFRLTGASPLVFATIEFSGLSPITVHSLNDGRHELLFSLDDLPARPPEPWAPDYSYLGPSWAWRLLRIGRYDVLDTWDNVVEGMARDFEASSRPKELELRPEVSGCADWSCRVERVLALLRQTRPEDLGWDRAEPLRHALASGRMSNLERALALKVTLERLGADAELAFGTGRLDRQISRDFPRARQFDHAFVVLPVQQGNARPLIIDPLCDACAPGEVAEPYAGTSIYAFDWSTVLDRTSASGAWLDVPSSAGVRRALSLKHRVTLADERALTDTYQLETAGDWATADDRRRQHEPRWLLNTERNWLRRISPLGAIDAASWKTCGPRRCTREAKVTMPDEVRREDERLLVPTTFLRALWEDVFERPDRTLDVHFRQGERIDETAELIAPEGYVLEALPAMQTATVGELRVQVRFEVLPTGVRITRSLDVPVSTVPRVEYESLRRAMELFRSARRQLLVFKRRSG